MKPNHGSSDGRAGDSRSKGPGFNPHLDPMRLWGEYNRSSRPAGRQAEIYIAQPLMNPTTLIPDTKSYWEEEPN